MYLIQGISAYSYQTQRLILPNGDPIILTVSFLPQQYGWFITELTYAQRNFTLQGTRIVVSPNILYQWKNQLGFGLACFTATNQEPTNQQDFSSGFAQLYLLSAAEVVQLTGFISGQARP